jgi:hypothetical protein
MTYFPLLALAWHYVSPGLAYLKLRNSQPFFLSLLPSPVSCCRSRNGWLQKPWKLEAQPAVTSTVVAMPVYNVTGKPATQCAGRARSERARLTGTSVVPYTSPMINFTGSWQIDDSNGAHMAIDNAATASLAFNGTALYLLGAHAVRLLRTIL